MISSIRGREPEREASGIDPQVLRADRLLRENKCQEAAKLYQICLDNEPDHAEVLRKLGYCRVKLKQTSGAREILHRLDKIRPGDDFAALYTGLSYAMDNNIPRAIEAWRSYSNLKKPLIQREINLILALHERGDELEASQLVKSVEKAIADQISSQG